MKEIVNMVKEVGCEGFQDTDLVEIQELIDTLPEELTEDILMEMSASEWMQDEEKDVEEAVTENRLTLDSLAEGSDYSRLLLTSLTTWTLLWYGHWT